MGLREDVEILDLEEVAGLRALDPDRPGQRVSRFLVLALEIGDACRRGDLAVARIARLEDQLLAGRDLDYGGDVGVPAIVPGMRLVLQALAAVDADFLDGSLPSLGRFAASIAS
jgi:hypothetical protein